MLMKHHLTRHYKKLRYTRAKFYVLVIILNIILMPNIIKYEKEEFNLYHIFLNGSDCGYLPEVDDLQDILGDARKELALKSDGMVYVDPELTYDASYAVFAEVDSKETVKNRMVDILDKNRTEVLMHAYTMRIGDYTINLSSADEIRQVLQAALNMYDDKNIYTAHLIADPNRELNALTVEVVKEEELEESLAEEPVTAAGVSRFWDDALVGAEEHPDAQDFEDYEYGILSMEFDDNIEIVECYLTPDRLTTVEKAIEKVVSVEEKNTIYEVQDGDTLSEIAIKTGIPMDKIISLNASLDDENAMIRSGDELIVTTTEPPIMIKRVEQEYIEEIYDAEIQYVDNNDWYTTDRVTLQQPSAGRRNIVALLSYDNDKEITREVVKEEVLLEAVPKIIERGTKIPPTYIKPISGGRMSSNFGRRKAPTKGASTNHQGIDWATPIGTAIYASCGGTVTKAGWGSGYGYVVYIKHPDGKETRYGHCSKVLVSAGQTVKQGQKIALSGNTGRSTGPHLHFEIRIGGSAVNPLKYLN